LSSWRLHRYEGFAGPEALCEIQSVYVDLVAPCPRRCRALTPDFRRKPVLNGGKRCSLSALSQHDAAIANCSGVGSYPARIHCRCNACVDNSGPEGFHKIERKRRFSGAWPVIDAAPRIETRSGQRAHAFAQQNRVEIGKRGVDNISRWRSRAASKGICANLSFEEIRKARKIQPSRGALDAKEGGLVGSPCLARHCAQFLADPISILAERASTPKKTTHIDDFRNDQRAR
jgi:hypothetical protein